MSTQQPPDPADALVRLDRAVRRAIAAERKHGGGLLDFYMPNAGSAALVELMRDLENEHPELQTHVASEHEMASLMIEAVAASIAAQAKLADLAALAAVLKRRLANETDRWVAVPIANLQVVDRVVVLDTDASGQTRAVLVPTVRNLRDHVQRQRARRLEDELASAINTDGRWVRSRFTSGPADATDAPGNEEGHRLSTDSRVGALLVLRESGPRRLARHRALTEARFAVAMWCLDSPPDRQFDGFALWPTIADWQPLPYLSVEPRTVPLGPSGKRTARSDGAEYEYAEYVLSSNADQLGLPWRALSAAPSLRPARALLSTAWALYLALRLPGQMQLTDRLIHLMAAREAMCTPPAGVRGSAQTRWETIASRFRLYERLSAEMDVTDADLVEERVAAVRNLTAHAGDAYSLAIGGPIDSSRHKNVERHRLAPATMRADAALASTAIARVASGLLAAADAADFAPEAYEALFA